MPWNAPIAKELSPLKPPWSPIKRLVKLCSLARSLPTTSTPSSSPGTPLRAFGSRDWSSYSSCSQCTNISPTKASTLPLLLSKLRLLWLLLEELTKYIACSGSTPNASVILLLSAIHKSGGLTSVAISRRRTSRLPSPLVLALTLTITNCNCKRSVGSRPPNRWCKFLAQASALSGSWIQRTASSHSSTTRQSPRLKVSSSPSKRSRPQSNELY